MNFEHEGRRYQLRFGSDVQNDRTFSELNDVSARKPITLLYGERDDVGGEIRFLCAESGWPLRRPIMVPLSLVERFIEELKQTLGTAPSGPGGPPPP